MELILILAVFLAFIIFSNSRRSKQAKVLEASVAVGAQVIMLGGIKGKIVSILEDTVIVETTPGTRIEFVKAAVRTVVPAEASVKQGATKKVSAPATTEAKPVKKTTSAAKTTTTTKKTAK
jgi:preprotein translocase subunit YajC